MKLSNKVYDVFKWIAQYFLPTLATVYFTLAQSGFDLPYPEAVVGAITAVDTLLGLFLGISSHGYTGEGVLKIDHSDAEVDKYELAVDIPLEELANRKSVTFKVDNSVG